jgi:hypothetical protein
MQSSTWKEVSDDGLMLEVPQSIFVQCVYNANFSGQLFPAKVDVDASNCGPRPPWLPCAIGFARADVAYSGGVGMCPETHRYAYSGWETDRGRCCKFKVDPASGRCEDKNTRPTAFSPALAEGILAESVACPVPPCLDYDASAGAGVSMAERAAVAEVLVALGEKPSGDFCDWPGVKSTCVFAVNTTSPPLSYGIKLDPVVVQSDGSSEKPYVVFSERPWRMRVEPSSAAEGCRYDLPEDGLPGRRLVQGGPLAGPVRF